MWQKFIICIEIKVSYSTTYWRITVKGKCGGDFINCSDIE